MPSEAANIRVSLVKLPTLWQQVSSDLWAIDSALGGRGGFRDVARRTHAKSKLFSEIRVRVQISLNFTKKLVFGMHVRSHIEFSTDELVGNSMWSDTGTPKANF